MLAFVVLALNLNSGFGCAIVTDEAMWLAQIINLQTARGPPLNKNEEERKHRQRDGGKEAFGG